MQTTYSFDIFDTCLCRLCGEPRNMLDVLSLKVQRLIGNDCTEHMRQTFVVARAGSHGHSLQEIYTNVANKYTLPCSINEMVQLELDTEREMLVPIKATLRIVNEARAKGHRILFISDMYLPDDFLRERLEAFGFYHEGDGLYVSDTIGASKYDDSLYWGKPFVGSLHGKHKGVWNRGNRANAMPRWLMNIYYSILDNPTTRTRLNRIASLVVRFFPRKSVTQ